MKPSFHIQNNSLHHQTIDRQTYHIQLNGVVQGVGFRPFVYQLAKEQGLHGYVCNAADGVHIEVNATEQQIHSFYKALLSKAPPLANIISHTLHQVENKFYNDFKIIESLHHASALVMLTPDFALCNECRNEVHNSSNYRYHYPFITCTHCGPRFSIMQRLPYDRQNTTMHHFSMCSVCAQEYNNVHSRRYYSQTNSCEKCGIEMQLYNHEKKLLCKGNNVVIAEVVKYLHEGNIIAIKGIGGYLLCCDATNANAVLLLRLKKHRPCKPFAVMYSHIQQLAKHVILFPEAETQLQNAVSPIVVLTAQPEIRSYIAFDAIAPGLQSLGVMLPYAPIFELILHAFQKPIVATSGNISGSSILYKDEDALNAFSTIADYIVTHNREIVVPQDDSVMQFSPQFHLPVILRRSRGWAPAYFNYKNNTSQTILATGALLKSSFALLHQQQVFISQYLGNTDSVEAQQTFQHVLHHILNLLNVEVQTIVTDLHPLYFSHQYAYQIGQAEVFPVKEVQHHEAHFAAILGEHHLQLQAEPVLGIVWDGTGLGNDGNIWGGEFFYYKEGVIQRYAHVGYFPFLLGDKMPREPRLSALSLCYMLPHMEEVLKLKFSDAEWKLYGAMLQQPASLFTSSIGRIFDAVASLLNVCNVQSYEAEASLMLEMLAREYVQQHGLLLLEHYNIHIENGNIFMKEFMNGILEDIVIHKKPANFIAAKFHVSLAYMVQQMAQQAQVSHIAFSGGVFQNALLVDMLYALLQKNYNLYFHKQLSPNDENISFGQMVYADWNMSSLTDANSAIVQECDATTVAIKIKSW